MVTFRYVFSILSILLITGCSGTEDKIGHQLSLAQKVEAYVVFPAALHYQHTGFDTYKQTALFQKAFQKDIQGIVVPFQEIKTRSVTNYFDQSNLYLLLKNQGISYQNVLILQPEIVKYRDATTMQITDQKGGQQTRQFQKDHYKITIRVYHPKSKKTLLSKTIKFSITPFDIDYENPDTTYFITHQLKILAHWSTTTLNRQFQEQLQRPSQPKKFWQFNPVMATRYTATISEKAYHNQEQLDPLFKLLLGTITQREKMILKRHGGGLVVIKDHKPFKRGDLLATLRSEKALKKGGIFTVMRGGKPVELKYTGQKQ